jgi:uncharacterized protein YkwD
MNALQRRLVAGLAAACAAIALGCKPANEDDAQAPAGAADVAASASGKGSKAASSKGADRPDLAAMESEVLARVNRYRKSEGLPALSNDPRIAEIARGHSRAMASGRSGFGHGGFRDRAKTVDTKVRYQRVAENVARHRRRARAEIHRVAVDGWVHSWGHRRNIEGKYSLTGVGAALAPDGSIYLTQIFVAPR